MTYPIIACLQNSGQLWGTSPKTRMEKIVARYQVTLSTGEIINVPNDKARTPYEYISTYGLNAVIERVKRTSAYKRAVEKSDAHIRSIICPDGEEITQF